MENTVKKREWVKTAAIIFLAVMLVLTFFSKTILNASLPEVATAQVSRGTINARLRGQGTVSANETYEVTISQTRKVGAVKCRVGDTVNAGDVLFILEETESEELKTAQETLESMQLNYSKSLISAGNEAAQENRHIQDLRDAYNEALDVYNQYSSMDASQLTRAKAQADARLKDLSRQAEDLNDALTELQGEDYQKLQQKLTELEQKVTEAQEKLDGMTPGSGGGRTKDEIQKEIDALKSTINNLENTPEYRDLKQSYRDALQAFQDLDDRYIGWELDSDALQLEISQYYDLLTVNICKNDENLAKLYARDLDRLVTLSYEIGIVNQMTAYQDAQITAQKMSAAYEAKVAKEEFDALESGLRAQLNALYDELNNLQSDNTAQEAYERAERALKELERDRNDAEYQLQRTDAQIDRLKDDLKAANRAVKDQQEVVERLSSASGAAETVKSARKALEDALFEQGLADANALDMQKAKDDIAKQEELIEKLTQDADAQEVKAKVGGVIGEINVNAGNTVGADSPLAVINLVDRGYTVQVPVSIDDAKKVKVGDTAELLNYWGGDVNIVLEKIASDPNNPTRGRMLVFRIEGGIEPGTNVTISIGQKSANYDALIPLSAFRTDSNGTYALVVTSKSTPLGNRYTATRVDVTELGRDDTYAAVTGLTAGDFVITTSTQPLSAGTQVRLADNG